MDEMLRAADHDREKVVGILKEHYVQGRLDQAELDERTNAALTAKRLGDLHALTRDLPSEPAVDKAVPPSAPAAVRRPWSLLTWLGIVATVVLVGVVVLTVGLVESLSHGVAGVVHDVLHILHSVVNILPSNR